MAQAADFFVSYTSADQAWAEWIAWQLEAEGYSVVVQAWDFTAGRDWAHEMQQATATARRVVPVLSAAYLRSAHGEAEWRVFYAEDPSGERRLLLPVRVDKVDPPGLLKTRVYVDLVDRDAAGARTALLAAVRDARGKPIEEPEFPGKRQAAGSATEAPRFPGELPPVWNVPYHPNPYFTGRDLLLAEIHARLTPPDVESRRVALTGLGGMGKTQLAVEHAYRRRADYDLVWWVRSEQPTSLLGDFAALGRQPPLAAHLGLGEGASQEVVAAAVRGWLEHHQRWLLVLDNVEDPHQVVELLPRSATGHIVLTSRTEVGWEPLASVLTVEALAPADAAGLLLTRAEETGQAAHAAAIKLAATLGGLPLALEQAGAYVASTGTVTLAGYAQLFGTRALELLQRGQPLGYQHTAATTWSLALQTLEQTEPAAVDLLALAGFLAPEDLPQPLLATHHNQLPEPLASVAHDPLALGDAVAALRRYSLIRVVGDGLFVHRLLQTVVRSTLDANAGRVFLGAAVRLLRTAFPENSDEFTTWSKCDRLLPHVLVVADHAQRLEVEPEARLWLLSRAGLYLASRGHYQQAATLDEQVLAEYRRVLGDENLTTLQAMDDLAETRWALEDYQGAHQLTEQALARYRRVVGDDHPATLHSMNNLAALLTDLGDLQAGRHLHEETLDRYRRVLGDDHPATLWSMNNLATTLRRLGELQSAHDLYEQTLTVRRRVLGDHHPDTLQSMNDLAETRRALGDLQGAQDLHEHALAARRQVLGEDDPDTLQSIDNLTAIRRQLEGSV